MATGIRSCTEAESLASGRAAVRSGAGASLSRSEAGAAEDSRRYVALSRFTDLGDLRPMLDTLPVM